MGQEDREEFKQVISALQKHIEKQLQEMGGLKDQLKAQDQIIGDAKG